MSGKSIFSKAIRDENAHSQLFCNLMSHSKPFRALAFKFLFGNRLPKNDLTVHSQFNLGDEGRPDIKISINGSRDCRFVEVKLDKNCPPTRYQRLGYGVPTALVFLVPRGWKYRDEIPAGSALRLWSDLAGELELDQDLLAGDIFVREYLLLLNLTFPSIRFNRAEIKIMTDTSKEQLITVARKLHRIVDALAVHFAGLEVKGHKLGIEWGDTDSEYGFTIKVGKGYLLWVGMWSQAKLLLGAAYQDGPGWMVSRPTEGFSQSCDHYIMNLGNFLDSPNVVDESSRRLEATLKKMLASR